MIYRKLTWAQASLYQAQCFQDGTDIWGWKRWTHWHSRIRVEHSDATISGVSVKAAGSSTSLSIWLGGRRGPIYSRCRSVWERLSWKVWSFSDCLFCFCASVSDVEVSSHCCFYSMSANETIVRGFTVTAARDPLETSCHCERLRTASIVA